MAIHLQDLILDNLTADPASPSEGCIWYRSDLFELRMRQNGITVALAETGPIGPAGADGDITWEGAWSAGEYTANQAVKYTDGNSYVCHTNTTSGQLPTDTNFWDVLAEKGDQGPAGDVDLTRATSSSEITRTSTSYGAITGMSITPAAGDYLVVFNATVKDDTTGGKTFVAIHADGTIDSTSEISLELTDFKQEGMVTSIISVGKVTVNGSQAITADWKKINGGTATMYKRTINAIKVG